MATWNIGDKIQNRWEIHKILGGAGKSGMGIVYVVYDHKLKEVRAAKTFQEEAIARQPKTAERFKQEALTWIKLEAHPNVAEAIFFETIEGRPLLFLEYVSGGDLSRWIGSPRLTEDLHEVLRLAVQFCDGMEHLQANGIMAHRDIKPANCLLTYDRGLKITDFGLSKVLAGSELDAGPENVVGRDVSPQLSATGMAAGTPPYMAPEQFRDAKHVDVKVDIYAFGVMLFEMVTGRLPFAGRTWQEWKQQHWEQAPPGLGVSSGPQAPARRELQELIHACLAKLPGKRPDGFAFLRESFARVCSQLTGQEIPAPMHRETSNAARQSLRLRLDSSRSSNKGMSLVGLGRTEEGLAALDAALRLNPRNEHAWDGKGYTLHVVGRYDEALAACEAALQINPRYEYAWCNKGNTLRELGRREEALAAFEAALRMYPRSYQAWTNKGNVLADLGQKQQALAAYEMALEFNLRFENAWINKGSALFALGRHGEAMVACDTALEINQQAKRAWYHKGLALAALGRNEEALRAYEAEIRINPGYANAWHNKGSVLVNGLGRAAEALACFEQAQKLGGQNPAQAIAVCQQRLALQAGGRGQATAPAEIMQLGLDAVKSQRWQDALVAFEKVLRTNPLMESAWVSKGAVLEAMGRKEEALADHDTALRINPQYELAWYAKGNVLRDLGRNEEALAAFEAALRIKPQYELASYAQGFTLSALGRQEEALAAYEDAIVANPRSEDAWLNKGNILVALGRKEEAAAAYDRSIHINPQSEKALTNKGNVLFELGRKEEALAAYEAVLRINPRSQQGWYHKGVLLLNGFGQHAEALLCFEQARKLGHPRAADQMALCQQKPLQPSEEGAPKKSCSSNLLGEERPVPASKGAQTTTPEELLQRGVEASKAQRYEDALAAFDAALRINTRFEHAWGNKAVVLGTMGLYQEALAAYEAALRINPESAQGWLGKGTMLSKLGKWEDALAAYEAALRITPYSEIIWTNKGVVLQALGRREGALAAYEAALRINPRTTQAWFNKGVLLHNVGRQADASACFEQAKKLGHPEAAQFVTSSQQRLPGQAGEQALLASPDELLRHGTNAAKAQLCEELMQPSKPTVQPNLRDKPPRAIRWVPKVFDTVFRISRLNIWFAQRLLNKANSLVTLAAMQQSSPNLKLPLPVGWQQEALATFEAALRLNPRLARAWSNKGNFLIVLGRKEEALAAYEEALRLNFLLDVAWNNKGCVLRDLGRNEEALAAFEVALRSNPQLEPAWLNKGLVLSALGRNDEALAAYESALRIKPQFAQAWLNKGTLLRNAFGRHAEASVCFEEAKKLGHPQAAQAVALCQEGLAKPAIRQSPATLLPRVPPIQNPLPLAGGKAQLPTPEELLQLGMEPKKTKRWQEALAYFEAALQINPRLELAWVNKGVVLSKLDRKEDALAACEAALRLNPKLTDAWINKGDLLYELGRKEEALEAMEAVLRVNPQLTQAWFNKGVLLTEFGRHAEALPCYEEAQNLGQPQAAQAIAFCRKRLVGGLG